MQTIETKRSNRVLVWSVIVVLLLAAVLVYRHVTRERVEVRTAQATHQTLVSSVSTNGKVEPIDEYQAHAPGPGIVKKLYVQVGDKVRSGALLVALDAVDAQARVANAASVLNAAQASQADMTQGGTQEERIAISGDLERAKGQKAQAEKDVAALQQLEQHGAASAAEVASAQQRLVTAQSTLKSIEARSTGRYSKTDLGRTSAQVADARASLAAAQSNYAANVIRSPIAGTVYALPVSAYDFVPAGEDLLDVADLDHVKILAYFDEPEIGKLQEGQEVSIKWDAKPGQTWHGHVELAPTTIITYGTRNVGECYITVDDAHGDLLPNINVTVTVTTSKRVDTLSVPREALHTDAGNYVYKVVDDKLVRTPIQIGVSNLTQVEVLSGLNEHDVVALNSTSNRDLTNGLEVQTAKQ